MFLADCNCWQLGLMVATAPLVCLPLPTPQGRRIPIPVGGCGCIFHKHKPKQAAQTAAWGWGAGLSPDGSPASPGAFLGRRVEGSPC